LLSFFVFLFSLNCEAQTLPANCTLSQNCTLPANCTVLQNCTLSPGCILPVNCTVSNCTVNCTVESTPTISATTTFTFTATPTVSNTTTATPTLTPTISVTPTISDTATISESTTTTASLTNTASATESATNTPTNSRTRSLPASTTPSRTPTNSRINPSESNTNTATASATQSKFSSPSSSPIPPRPVDLPFFVQPGGVSTGELYIQLRVFTYGFGYGVEDELRRVIAIIMDIPVAAVEVIKIEVNQLASVVICTGNIATFANQLNEGANGFDGTILEGAYIQFLFWDVPCLNPLDSENLPTYSGVTYSDPNESDSPLFDFSTFRFPNQPDESTADSPPALAPSSKYVSGSNVIVPIDDDEFIVIDVNTGTSLYIFTLLVILIATLLF